ncbi:putative methyltransferase [Streptomyces sp. NBRC 110611]|uniref:hypothetical protein n=1 Tax=Streptomyces sp. NBRC 110611 TaxID=1621259 RepID=UPI0008299FBA|nr:hypothetical protein [Streptomyces sp. NBRC 110611]GAU64666.1 putative methyltransferase [Streptomyces sp. NBRC 110611]
MEPVFDVPESPAQPADSVRVNDYDSFAEAYSAESENNIVTAYYARPAMLALAGDVAGRRILDAGCGSGPLSAALRDRGAVVTAGFRLSVISEPQPDPAARELFPDGFHDLSTKPAFLFFVVEVPPSTASSGTVGSARPSR